MHNTSVAPKRQMRNVRNAIGSLNVRYRKIPLLYYLEQHSFAEESFFLLCCFVLLFYYYFFFLVLQLPVGCIHTYNIFRRIPLLGAYTRSFSLVYLFI